MQRGRLRLQKLRKTGGNKLVQMTEVGSARYEKVVRHITWAEDTAMSMFTPEEQTRLIDLSRAFTKNLTMLVNQETEG